LQNTGGATLTLPGVESETESGTATSARLQPVAAAKFDLDLTVTEHFAESGESQGLSGTVIAAADLFDPGTVAALAERFVRVLETVAADADLHLSEIGIVSEKERREVVTG
ncbi:hypothetical protein J4573_53455, partial [Actinomadura barringtoniae]